MPGVVAAAVAGVGAGDGVAEVAFDPGQGGVAQPVGGDALVATPGARSRTGQAVRPQVPVLAGIVEHRAEGWVVRAGQGGVAVTGAGHQRTSACGTTSGCSRNAVVSCSRPGRTGEVHSGHPSGAVIPGSSTADKAQGDPFRYSVRDSLPAHHVEVVQGSRVDPHPTSMIIRTKGIPRSCPWLPVHGNDTFVILTGPASG